MVLGNYYVNYQNYQNLMLLTSSDTKKNTDASIIVYKFRPERTGFNVYAEYTHPKFHYPLGSDDLNP